MSGVSGVSARQGKRPPGTAAGPAKRPPACRVQR
jgi:hypothetical protein